MPKLRAVEGAGPSRKDSSHSVSRADDDRNNTLRDEILDLLHLLVDILFGIDNTHGKTMFRRLGGYLVSNHLEEWVL